MAKKKVSAKKKASKKKAAAAPKSVKKPAKAAGKKKAAVKKAAKKATKKKAAKKTAPAKQAAPEKNAAPSKPAAKKSPKKNSKPTQAAVKKASDAMAASTQDDGLDELGRPRLSADTFLDRIFEHDVKARQAFEFLEIHTLRELESLDPDDLVSRLTSPTIQTVGRIRGGLALLNRHLKGDEKFAKQFQARVKREQKANR